MSAGRAGALFVAAGIFLSRIAGFAREAVFAWALGSSDAADAFKAALRIPNFLQNLFGEGALSASFIPVYRKIHDEDPAAATKLAGAVLALMTLATSLLVLAGVAGAPLLVDLLAPGFDGEKRDQTVLLVRVLFPGVGLLVGSAWCLGVLDAHRRFFPAYVAPVAWNAAIVCALFLANGRVAYDVALWAAGGAVVGSALQVVVQLPFVVPLVRGLRISLATSSPAVRRVLVQFVPGVLVRGVAQVSAFVEEVLASFLARGSIANIAYAQTIAMLPLSLFGMSVAVAAGPDLASAVRAQDLAKVRERLAQGARRIAFFVVPSAVAFVVVGDVMAGLLFQRGAFGRDSSVVVHAVLAAGAVGLYASTQSRLVAQAFYAFEETRVALRFAIARVVVGASIGAPLALYAPDALGVDPRFGPAGLALGTSVGAVIELLLLRSALSLRLASEAPGVGWATSARLVGAAGLAGAVAWGAQRALPDALRVEPRGVVVLGAFALVYGAATFGLGVDEARAVVARVRRRVRH